MDRIPTAYHISKPTVDRVRKAVQRLASYNYHPFPDGRFHAEVSYKDAARLMSEGFLKISNVQCFATTKPSEYDLEMPGLYLKESEDLKEGLVIYTPRHTNRHAFVTEFDV